MESLTTRLGAAHDPRKPDFFQGDFGDSGRLRTRVSRCIFVTRQTLTVGAPIVRLYSTVALFPTVGWTEVCQ